MDDIIIDIFTNSKGVFDYNLNNLKPIKQVFLKDVYKYEKYIEIDNNKIHLFLFDKEDDKTDSFINEDADLTTFPKMLGQFIYKTKYYSIRFKPIIVSFYEDEPALTFKENDIINVYSKKDLPRIYYNLTEDLFENIKIISCIMYRNELTIFLQKLKKNEIVNNLENFDLNNLTWC